jgi:hypothetical protein
MAKNIQAPDDVQIAAMNIEYERIGNLMAPGPGTPWEDRGSIGAFAAFFKTAIMSMTSPRTLLFSLRRPETPGDARVFAIICGVFWAVSWVLHDYIYFKRFSREVFDITSDGEIWVFHFVLALVGTWLLLNVISLLFFKLVSSGDVKAKAPQVLTYNVFAYCLGPSILALIPFYIGPGIALVWIVCLFMYGAMTRLAVKTSGAIICTLLSVGGVLGLSVGAYFLISRLLGWLYS